MSTSQKSALNVFLVGPMGAGKTTIGKRLAEALGLAFVDSDHEIELRTGAKIPWIFDIEGEAGFRRREKEVVQALTARRGIVLATGGGVVLDADNRARLVDGGMVIYLTAPLEHLLERTASDKNRPLLQTDDPRGRFQAMLEQRDPLYRQVADIVVDTSVKNVRALVQDLVLAVRRYQSGATTDAREQRREYRK